MKIEDDDDADLDELYQSIDYDPFGDKAFDDYLNKRGKSLQAQSEMFYKPQKRQKTVVSSKDLFAAQTVLSSEKTEAESETSFKVSKSGFKAMKIKRESPKTQSCSSFNEFDANDMIDIESYIAQQHEASSSNNYYNRDLALPSDNSPDPGTSTPIDSIVENDSSPEPQRNCSFHVVKKTKPKKKKRKKNKRKKFKKNKEMEPEDCTIRYENVETVTDKITKKIASMRNKTNPFDMIDDEQDGNTSIKLKSTNPVAESTNTNPFMNDDLP